MTEEFYFARPRYCGIADATRCEVVTAATLAVAGIVLAAAGAGVGAYSAIEQGKQAEAAGKYNAKVQRNNAVTARNQANFEADRIRKRNRLVAGKQRANYLKSGIDLSGSAEDVILDSAIEGELDVAAAQYAGASAAQSQVARARLSEYEGRAAGRAGYVRAGGAILSGASSAVGSYTSYKQHSDPDF